MHPCTWFLSWHFCKTQNRAFHPDFPAFRPTPNCWRWSTNFHLKHIIPDSCYFCHTELSSTHQRMETVYFELYIYVSGPNGFDSLALIKAWACIQAICSGLKWKSSFGQLIILAERLKNLANGWFRLEFKFLWSRYNLKKWSRTTPKWEPSHEDASNQLKAD